MKNSTTKQYQRAPLQNTHWIVTAIQPKQIIPPKKVTVTFCIGRSYSIPSALAAWTKLIKKRRHKIVQHSNKTNLSHAWQSFSFCGYNNSETKKEYYQSFSLSLSRSCWSPLLCEFASVNVFPFFSVLVTETCKGIKRYVPEDVWASHSQADKRTIVNSRCCQFNYYSIDYYRGEKRSKEHVSYTTVLYDSRQSCRHHTINSPTNAHWRRLFNFMSFPHNAMLFILSCAGDNFWSHFDKHNLIQITAGDC